MTYPQFKTSYNGKKWDFDGKYSSQCVDLIRFYWKERGQSQPKGVIGAKDFWTAYSSDSNLNTKWERIENTPSGVPKQGDIIIWGSTYGQYGHIAIVDSADVNSFTALSQNDPIGRETHIKTYNYNNTLGWMHPRKETMSKLLTMLDVPNDDEAIKKIAEHLGEVNGKCNWGLTGDKGGYLGSERKKNQELTTENLSHKIEISALQAENAQLRQDLIDCEAQDPGIDPAGWVKNGLTVEVLSGNTKTITNYKRA